MATVNVGADETPSVGRTAAGNIAVNGVNCGAATVSNTDTIRVTGQNAGGETVTVNLANGPFAPGKTAETGVGAVSEIEFYVILRDGYDTLAINGGPTADNIVLGSGGINVNGDNDIDVFRSGIDTFEVSGNNGADVISAAGNAATGQPVRTDVTLSGGSGADQLTGGTAFDTLSGEADGDVLNGGPGYDELSGGPGNDQLNGGTEGDTLIGGVGNDLENGGPGADSFEPDFVSGTPSAPDGADVMSGGNGEDTLDLSDRTDRVRVTLDNLANDGADADANGVAEEGDNAKADIEEVFGGFAADFINANTAAANAALASNTLYGGDSNDQISGGLGDDYLSGDQGADALNGGPDDDSLYGGDGVDTLHGDDGNDQLTGEDGGDQQFGDAGDDRMTEESFNDGPDNISGGAGVDTLSYYWRSLKVIITEDNVANDGADDNPAHAGADELDNVHADIEEIEGGDGNDVINANTGPANAAFLDNSFDGGPGADILSGGSGDDILRGGDGNDTINGNTGEDQIDGEGGADSLPSNDLNWYDEVDCGFGDGVPDPAAAHDGFDLVSNCP